MGFTAEMKNPMKGCLALREGMAEDKALGSKIVVVYYLEAEFFPFARPHSVLGRVHLTSKLLLLVFRFL